MGKTPDDFTLKTKSLSFYDFAEEKKSLIRKNQQNLDFDYSDGDETSDW